MNQWDMTKRAPGTPIKRPDDQGNVQESGSVRASKNSGPGLEQAYDYDALLEAVDKSQKAAFGTETWGPYDKKSPVSKSRTCTRCGGTIKGTSRMILSPVAGLALFLLGAILIGVYGFMINYFQTPWYIKFLLPASYYIGAIFLAVGTLFFFIREKVWLCGNCKHMVKR